MAEKSREDAQRWTAKRRVALVWFLHPEFQRGELSSGARFEIREGRLVRGHGVVTKLLSLK